VDLSALCLCSFPFSVGYPFEQFCLGSWVSAELSISRSWVSKEFLSYGFEHFCLGSLQCSKRW
jgi:hypothetical protein